MSSSSMGFSFFLVVLYMLEGRLTAFCRMWPPVPLGDLTLLFTSSGDWGTSDGLTARRRKGLPRIGCPYSKREKEYSPSERSVYPTSYVPFLLSVISVSAARLPSTDVISALKMALPVRTNSPSCTQGSDNQVKMNGNDTKTRLFTGPWFPLTTEPSFTVEKQSSKSCLENKK